MNIICFGYRKNIFLWAGLFWAFYYQTYRYPFGYGIEPPLHLRIAKYVLLGGLCLLMLPQFFGKIRKFKLFEWGFLFAFSILGIYGYLQQEKFFVQVTFFGFVAFCLAQCCEQVSYRSLQLFITFAWVVDTVFYLSQAIGLEFFDTPFFWSGPNVFSSRFGGMLLDPLGAPYFSFLFLGLAFDFKGWLRWLIVTTSLIAIAMTQTLTGWCFFAISLNFGMAVWTFHRFGLRLALIQMFAVCSTLIAVIIAFWFFRDAVLPGKWGSILLHVEYWWPKRWPWFPTHDSMFSETFWVFSVQSMGVLWTIVYILLMYVLIRDCASRAGLLIMPKTGESVSGVFLGIYLSGAFIVFGSLNQLYPAIYPVGLISLLFAFMIKYNKISKKTEVAKI